MTTPPKIAPEIFRLLVESVRDYAIFILDTKGHILTWNAGAQALKGYNPEEVVGKHFSIFYPLDAIERDWPGQELRGAIREGRFEDEGWRVRKDGGRFWASVVITALRDPGGKLIGYSKITRDLTTRREQEERLRQSEERFRLLVDAVQDHAMYMLSPDGIITSWNAGAQRIKGYSAAEMIGQHFSRFYPPEEIESGKPWQDLASARVSGRAEEEGWRIRASGERFWARVVLTPIRDAQRRLVGFAKVTQDLTTQRQTREIEETGHRINEFIAMLAHELRNPLAPIRNAVNVMEHLAPGDPRHAQLREIISRQGHHLSRIVDDLLDINRITRGTFNVERERVDIADFVARGVEIARPVMDEAGQHLDVALPARPLNIQGDLARLTQVMANLLNNAARYTPRGGRISVSAQVEDEEIVIRVKDTGRGIQPENLERIFNLFDQGGGSGPTHPGGLGIGLSLTRRIVELHGGTIVAVSEGPGKGSEFIVRLMVAGASALPHAPKAAAVTSSRDHPSQRVLIVDDNIDAAETLELLVKADGHETRVAHNGMEALELALEFRPDVVLLDIGMPDISGYEVARRLRLENATRRSLIVAVSGWTLPADQAQSRDAGFDYHFAKPLALDALKRILRQPRPGDSQLH